MTAEREEVELNGGPSDGHRVDIPAGIEHFVHFGVLYVFCGLITKDEKRKFHRLKENEPEPN